MKKILSVILTGVLLWTTPVLAQVDNESTQPGYELKDPARGIDIKAPSAIWSVNGSKWSIYMSHGTYYDSAFTLRKSYYTVATAQEAYDKRKESLKSFMPGAVFLKEAEALTISGLAAMSMTYKNPSDLKIIREILLIHKGVPYEIEFKTKEENFEKVKADFAFILSNLKFY